MDLNAVTGYGAGLSPLPWRDGDAWLGGGTWLFSQPQPRLRRLLDLHAFGWPPLTETDDGLSIAATCTLAQLRRLAARAAVPRPGGETGPATAATRRRACSRSRTWPPWAGTSACRCQPGR